MKKQVKSILTFVAIPIIILFLVVLINQSTQFILLVSTINPLLGQISGVVVVLAFVAIIGVPIVSILRFPKHLVPPKDTGSEQYLSYRKEIQRRLSGNKRITKQKISFAGPKGIEEAFDFLNSKADAKIKETASAVFLTTAISQNGKLDGLMVLIGQCPKLS